MDISEVKRNLNKTVFLNDSKLHAENVPYILTGCILRLNEHGYYYQVELKDVRHSSSLVIASLNNIREVPD